MSDYNKTKRDLIENAFKATTFDATVKILKDEGLDGLQMQRIATETGVSTGTLYNYFKNKQDLLLFVHEKLCADFFSVLGQVDDSDDSPDKKVIDFIRHILNFIVINKDIFGFIESSGVFKEENIKTKYEHHIRFIELFSGLLQDGIDQKLLNDIDPRKTAELFHACIVGIFKVNTEFKYLQPDLEGEELVKLFSVYLGIGK